MDKPTLSIGMIVKNEIRSIEKCLQALQPLRDAFPCELVIADTGSDDGTREVAARYADILFDFPWIDDFAAARNAVMGRCSGIWYFSVDADEYLDPDLSGFRALFCLPSQEQPDLCGVTVRNYMNRDLAHADYCGFTAVRIARLHSGISYKGAIHESFYRSGKPTRFRPFLDIILHHDGYAFQSPAEARQKYARNLALLDKVLEENPEDPRCLVECIESAAVFQNRVVQYVLQGMELLEKPNRTPNAGFDGYLAARCAEVALALELPQGEKWLEKCFTQYSSSTAVRLDAAYAAIKWYWKEKEYDKVASTAPIYLDAFAAERSGKIPMLDQVNISFQHNNEKNRFQVLAALSSSLARLDRKGEAFQNLTGWTMEKVPAECVKDWLCAMALLENVSGAAEEMARVLPLHRRHHHHQTHGCRAHSVHRGLSGG